MEHVAQTLTSMNFIINEKYLSISGFFMSGSLLLHEYQILFALNLHQQLIEVMFEYMEDTVSFRCNIENFYSILPQVLLDCQIPNKLYLDLQQKQAKPISKQKIN